MSDQIAILEDNLAAIRDQIAEATTATARKPSDVTVVAVTKYVDAELTRDLVTAGCKTLGESRPQAFWEKADKLSDLDIDWHFVGHLQRNKVRRTLPHVSLIHSVDSLRLLTEIDGQAADLGRQIPILLEVNISGDADKHGFAPDDLEPVLPQLATFSNVSIRGLMAMAHREGGPDVARRDFAAVRQLRDQLQTNAPDEISLDELSLGMSGDFSQAIMEGATIVRIGRALFQGTQP